MKYFGIILVTLWCCSACDNTEGTVVHIAEPEREALRQAQGAEAIIQEQAVQQRKRVESNE